MYIIGISVNYSSIRVSIWFPLKGMLKLREKLKMDKCSATIVQGSSTRVTNLNSRSFLCIQMCGTLSGYLPRSLLSTQRISWIALQRPPTQHTSLDCSASQPCLNKSGCVGNGCFNLEYKFRFAIFALSNQTSLSTALTLGIFSLTRCCVVAAMYKVSAQLFIINGYLCEIQSVIHCPELHPDFDEAQFY